MRIGIICLLILLTFSTVSFAKCTSGNSYALKGYIESDAGIPVTGKTLSTVLFDIFYDDGTSSLSLQASAEMGQGWYRYTYTSNGKSGVYIMRDSTSFYRNFPGGILETLCDSQDVSLKDMLDRIKRTR